MDDPALGASIRALRHRRGWRQADLAQRARVSPSVIVLVESGRLERVSLRCIRRVAAALDLRLAWDAGFRGAELARLRDADHAGLGEVMMRLLERFGWIVLPEVSFNHYGERGRIDILAYHAASRTLLVVELKTLIVDVQATLGATSVKQRVAPRVAQERGWRPEAVTPALVVLATTTNRRRLADHERLFARFTVRGRAASAWLRTPTGAPDGLLILLNLSNRNHTDVRRAGRRRVRVRAAASRSAAPHDGSHGTGQRA